MQEITRKDLTTILESSKYSEIELDIKGNINAKIVFSKYEIKITNDELRIKDTTDKNCIYLNFNTIRNIQKDENTITIYIDDNFDTTIKLKFI